MRTAPRIAVAATILAAPLLVHAPAEAALIGGSIEHYAPDNGYDPAIIVRCDGQRTRVRIHEGWHSDNRCDDEDVQKVFVRPGEEIICWHVNRLDAYWLKWKDATGWHDVGNFQNKLCTLKKD